VGLYQIGKNWEGFYNVASKAGGSLKAGLRNGFETLGDFSKWGKVGADGVEVFKVGENIAGITIKQIKLGLADKFAIIGRQMRGHVNDVAAALKTDGKYVEILNDDYLNYKFLLEGKEWTVNSAWDDMTDLSKYKDWRQANGFIKDEFIPRLPMYKVNKMWVDIIQRNGYTILDMGYPSGVTLESIFYNMEVKFIKWD